MLLTGICLAFFAVGLVAFIASAIEEVAEIIRRGGYGQASRPRTSQRPCRPLFRSNKQNGIAPGGRLDKRHRSRAPGWAPGNLGAPLVVARGLMGVLTVAARGSSCRERGASRAGRHFRRLKTRSREPARTAGNVG